MFGASLPQTPSCYLFEARRLRWSFLFENLNMLASTDCTSHSLACSCLAIICLSAVLPDLSAAVSRLLSPIRRAPWGTVQRGLALATPEAQATQESPLKAFRGTAHDLGSWGAQRRMGTFSAASDYSTVVTHSFIARCVSLRTSRGHWWGRRIAARRCECRKEFYIAKQRDDGLPNRPNIQRFFCGQTAAL